MFYLTVLPVILGFLLLFIKQEGIKRNLALLAFSSGLVISILFFLRPPEIISINVIDGYNLLVGLNKLSAFMLVFINLFGFLTCLYAKDYLEKPSVFFSYILWLVAFSSLVTLSQDFILFVFSWGATLVLLYALLNLGSSYSAKKALFLVGLADFSLILGVCMYIVLHGTTAMAGTKVVLNNGLSWTSFILMLLGAFAKAGCLPLHTWIPTAAESAPIPVMAILPASLDKLLGIYLLARICVDFFVLNNLALGILLFMGGLTIIVAVILALIQHDLRKLLSYHAVSQVGYMVMGFGTGIPIGIVGALFHMLNHTMYKTGLFFVGGAVGKQKKTFELDNLGGLAPFMPLTFICALVFALSISGVPPFNGFSSKWMLYQGAFVGLSGAQGGAMRSLYIFALVSAMFGSALTLASFVKFIHATFLGEKKSSQEKIKEVSLNMKLPLIFLALGCVLLGIFPKVFLKYFIEPYFPGGVNYIGNWNSVFVFAFIAAGFLLGLILWGLMKHKKVRVDNSFVGGEDDYILPSYPATEFYRTIEEVPAMKGAYRVLKSESADFYNILVGIFNLLSHLAFILIDRFIDYLTMLMGRIVLGLSWLLRKLHSGVLDMYLAWSLAGLVIFFLILMLK
jgi:formate hydrogenlyase subunit 3/multisubunit Na+/H+ antiporter MnhD subunit